MANNNATLVQLAWASLLAGCSLQPTTIDRELLDANAAVAAAHRACGPACHVEEVERAASKIKLADRLAAAGDRASALWLIEQAQVDAELASAKLEATRLVKVRSAALPR